MPLTLTDAAILPACDRLGLRAFVAAERDVVLVPMPPPAPGTTALTFAFIPNDHGGRRGGRGQSVFRAPGATGGPFCLLHHGCQPVQRHHLDD